MIDQALTPAAIADRLQKGGAKLNRDGDPVLLPKAQKNAVEIQGARDAHARDSAALARFLFWLSQRAPTGELDDVSAARIMRVLRLHAMAGAAVVVVTHNPDVAATADREIALLDGRIAS